MFVQYLGEFPADLTTLGIHVEPGDVVQVPSGFVHPQFVQVEAPKKKITTQRGDVDAAPK